MHNKKSSMHPDQFQKNDFLVHFNNWTKAVQKKLQAQAFNDTNPETSYVEHLNGISYDYTLAEAGTTGRISMHKNMLHITQVDQATKSTGATTYRLNAPALIGMGIRNMRANDYMLVLVYKGGKEDTLPVIFPKNVAEKFLASYFMMSVKK